MSTSLLLHSQAITEKKRGRCVIHNDDGSISVGHAKNHLRHGKWYSAYPNHQRKSFGKYNHGVPVGKHLAYWPDGKQRWIIEYEAGKRHGIFVIFDSKGDTAECSYYWHGDISGYHYMRDTINQSWERGEYIIGVKTGTWTKSVSDSLITCEYKENKKNGAFRAALYDNRIVQGYYKNDIRDSVWRVSMYDHVMNESWYTNGKKYKTEKIFFPNSDSVYCETKYRSPDEVAQFIVNQEPGIPGKIDWYSNRLVDSIHLYHPNGKIYMRMLFKKCYYDVPVVHEMTYVYSKKGVLLIKTISGPTGKDSLRYDYNANGNVFRLVKFSRGNIKATTYYYDNGNVRVKFSGDTIQAFAENGKRLNAGTPAYSKVFAQVDSIDNGLPFIPVYNDAEAPAPPYTVTSASDFICSPPVLPEFPGGTDSLKAYLQRNIRYPIPQKEQGVEGTVHIKFTVETDGSITGAQVIRSSPNVPAFTKEALRVVNAMPKWTPGRGERGPEKCYCMLPIKFSLQ